MKKLSKVLVLVLSAIMVLAMSASVFADTQNSGKNGPASITITLPTEQEAPQGTTTYKIYKVFDATSNGESSAISYKLVDGKTAAPTGFTVDSAGNVSLTRTTGDLNQLTEDEISAIAGYVGATDLVYTAEVAKGETSVTVTGLEYGYYYITTTTGSVVTVDSTNPTASVNDKNTIPKVEKTVSNASSYDADGKKALAQVGTDVEFTANVTVGAGSTNLVFHDTMSEGLSLNDSVTVTATAPEGGSAPTGTWYTIKETPDEGDTLTITFADGIAKDTVITIKYSAKVTSAALQDDPANNTAKLTYGEGNTTTSSSVELYNAKLTVTKQDGENKPLAGAGFVLKKGNQYYKIADGVVSWVDSIDDATEYTSAADGKLNGEFTGLANGTYTLVEKTVPAGYNKAADQNFTVDEHKYDAGNLKQTATVTNNAGSELPSTGGIGTTIFYVLGSLLVVGCGIVLVSRKRMEKNN